MPAVSIAAHGTTFSCQGSENRSDFPHKSSLQGGRRVLYLWLTYAAKYSISWQLAGGYLA